jgi:hypothetical protein
MDELYDSLRVINNVLGELQENDWQLPDKPGGELFSIHDLIADYLNIRNHNGGKATENQVYQILDALTPLFPILK